MFQLTALGRLGRDAEVKEVNGKKVLEFNIAVDTGFGDRKTTTWVQCSKWGENTAVSQYLTKGKQVVVSGEPSLNMYTNKDGKEVTSLRLNCNVISLCAGGSTEQQPAASNDFHKPTVLPLEDEGEQLPF